MLFALLLCHSLIVISASASSSTFTCLRDNNPVPIAWNVSTANTTLTQCVIPGTVLLNTTSPALTAAANPTSTVFTLVIDGCRMAANGTFIHVAAPDISIVNMNASLSRPIKIAITNTSFNESGLVVSGALPSGSSVLIAKNRFTSVTTHYTMTSTDLNGHHHIFFQNFFLFNSAEVTITDNNIYIFRSPPLDQSGHLAPFLLNFGRIYPNASFFIDNNNFTLNSTAFRTNFYAVMFYNKQGSSTTPDTGLQISPGGTFTIRRNLFNLTQSHGWHTCNAITFFSMSCSGSLTIAQNTVAMVANAPIAAFVNFVGASKIEGILNMSSNYALQLINTERVGFFYSIKMFGSLNPKLNISAGSTLLIDNNRADRIETQTSANDAAFLEFNSANVFSAASAVFTRNVAYIAKAVGGGSYAHSFIRFSQLTFVGDRVMKIIMTANRVIWTGNTVNGAYPLFYINPNVALSTGSQFIANGNSISDTFTGANKKPLLQLVLQAGSVFEVVACRNHWYGTQLTTAVEYKNAQVLNPFPFAGSTFHIAFCNATGTHSLHNTATETLSRTVRKRDTRTATATEMTNPSQTVYKSQNGGGRRQRGGSKTLTGGSSTPTGSGTSISSSSNSGNSHSPSHSHVDTPASGPLTRTKTFAASGSGARLTSTTKTAALAPPTSDTATTTAATTATPPSANTTAATPPASTSASSSANTTTTAEPPATTATASTTTTTTATTTATPPSGTASTTTAATTTTPPPTHTGSTCPGLPRMLPTTSATVITTMTTVNTTTTTASTITSSSSATTLPAPHQPPPHGTAVVTLSAQSDVFAEALHAGPTTVIEFVYAAAIFDPAAGVFPPLTFEFLPSAASSSSSSPIHRFNNTNTTNTTTTAPAGGDFVVGPILCSAVAVAGDASSSSSSSSSVYAPSPRVRCVLPAMPGLDLTVRTVRTAKMTLDPRLFTAACRAAANALLLAPPEALIVVWPAAATGSTDASALLTATATLLTISAVVAAPVATFFGPLAWEVQATVVLLRGPCAGPGEQHAARFGQYLLSPAAGSSGSNGSSSSGSPEVVVLVHVAVIFATAAIHTGITTVVFLRRQHKQQQEQQDATMTGTDDGQQHQQRLLRIESTDAAAQDAGGATTDSNSHPLSSSSSASSLFVSVCAALHFPSISFHVAFAAFPGIAWGIANIIHNNNDHSGNRDSENSASGGGGWWAVAVGAVTLLVIAAAAAAMSMRACCLPLLSLLQLNRQRFVMNVLQFRHRHRQSHPHSSGSSKNSNNNYKSRHLFAANDCYHSHALSTTTTTSTTGQGQVYEDGSTDATLSPSPLPSSSSSLPSRAMSLAVAVLGPQGLWTPLDAAGAVHGLRGFTNPRGQRTVWAAGLLIFLATTWLAAAPPRSDSCAARTGVVAAMMLAAAALVLALRPYNALVTSILTAVALLGVALVATGIASTTSNSGSGSGGGLAATVAGVVLVMVATSLRAAHLVCCLLHRRAHPALYRPADHYDTNTTRTNGDDDDGDGDGDIPLTTILHHSSSIHSSSGNDGDDDHFDPTPTATTIHGDRPAASPRVAAENDDDEDNEEECYEHDEAYAL